MNLIMMEKQTDLGGDSPISHDDHSEEDIRDCDSVSVDDEGGGANNLSSSRSSVTGIDMRTPEPQTTDVTINHPGHPHFPPNHPLNSLGNFMGMNGLHLQHGDVLEKLKMQVRDMKVGGLMDPDFSTSHSNFLANGLTQPVNTAFSLPSNSSLNGFSHSPQNLSQSHPHSISQLNSQQQHQQSQHHQQPQQLQTQSQSMGNGFSFVSPTTPTSCTKDANPASNSSTSSEASNSSQQNNGWSFEEQYKQVRQLYEINDDPKRKEFLDDLFSFMQKRGTPINRLPIMAKSVLDLYELYNLVIARGGLVDVINKKLWQEIIKGLHLPSSITSAAFTLRTQYMKYLYPYECDKKNLSSPSELQAAIDGNRREGRRSSYGHFETMPNPLQLPPMNRGNVPGGLQQMSPLALVTHSNSQANAAAVAAAAHHRLMGPGFGQIPGLMTHELEQRMMEYLKLIQSQKEPPRPRSQSPSDISSREAMNALEMSRLALWQMYQNNTSPPTSVNTSPQGIETQREALNLSESPPTITIKRERDLSATTTNDDLQPPAKRTTTSLATTQSTTTSHFHMPTPANSNSFSEDREEDEDDIDCDKSSPGGRLMEADVISPRSHTFREKSPNYLSPRIPRQQQNDISAFTGMQFKVVRKETTSSGEQQLSVVLELNGTQYEGVLLSSSSHLDKHSMADGRTSRGGLSS